MRLSELDAIQHEILAKQPHDGGCWSCKHSDLDQDGLSCCHPMNGIIKDIRAFFGVESLISMSLPEQDDLSSDNGVGHYCNLYEYHDYDNETIFDFV